MKKTVIISSLLFISFLFISQGLSAQRYYRNSPGIEGDYNVLNLTQEQIEEIDKLELNLSLNSKKSFLLCLLSLDPTIWNLKNSKHREILI